MQEVVTRYKVIYNMVAEIQSLVSILVQIQENTERDQPKVQMCTVESLTSQLGGSSYPSEGLYDTDHSRVPSRKSCGHATIPEMHNCPFTYRGIGDKLQSGTEDLRAYDQHQNQVKREMGLDQFCMPKETDLPCRYSRIGDRHEPGLADQRACEVCRAKIVMGHCPHRSPECKSIHSDTEKLVMNSSQVLTIKPLTHIKVQEKEWAVAGF